jgi:hypothetical protein
MADGFDIGQLMTAAEQTTGLSDWGDDDFREPLRILLSSLNEEAQLSEIGQARVRQWLMTRLTQRLRVLDDQARIPAIARELIDRPIFILGLPRAGTTFLHSLMGQDPEILAPLHWQLVNPSPPPSDPAIDHDAAIRWTQQMLEFQGWLDPELQKMHFSDACLPEEDFLAFELSFVSMSFYGFFEVPLYASTVFKTDDFASAYRWHKRVLQALQFKSGHKRVVLKAPEHTMHLDMLFQTYPDAVIVHNHRDPAKVMGSTMSLLSAVRARYTDREQAASAEVANRYVRSYARSFRRCMELRDDPRYSDRFIDVQYRDLEADPIAQVARVYAHAGMDFTPAVERKVTAWSANNRKGAHGKHRYPVEGFGLTPANVHGIFADYIRRFSVKLETQA